MWKAYRQTNGQKTKCDQRSSLELLAQVSQPEGYIIGATIITKIRDSYADSGPRLEKMNPKVGAKTISFSQNKLKPKFIRLLKLPKWWSLQMRISMSPRFPKQKGVTSISINWKFIS